MSKSTKPHKHTKTVLKFGMALSISVFSPYQANAVDVSTWAELVAATGNIKLTDDIQATGTTKTAEFNSGDNVIDGNNHSLTGAAGYSITGGGTSFTLQNFSSITGFTDKVLTLSATTSSISNVKINGNTAVNDDNAILTITKGTVSIDNLIFDSNSAPSGPPSWNMPLGLDFTGGTTTITNSVFQNNEMGVYGVLQLSGGVVTIDNSQFLNNTNKYADAAAISVTSKLNGVSNSTFKGNKAAGDGGAVWYSQVSGSPYFLNTTFENNESKGLGGAIFICGTSISTGPVSFLTSDFKNNKGSYGGAIFSEGLENLFVVDTSFSGNTANEGGAIYVADENLNIFADSKDVIFSDNVAKNDTEEYNGGAAVYFQGTSNNAFNINASEGRKVVFDDTIAAYGEGATIDINKSGLSYIAADDSVVSMGNAGEIQFNDKVGDENYLFNINLYDGTLTIGNNAKLYANLDAKGGTVNINNQKATVKTANFDANSTLALTINSLSDYGNLTADTITVANGATLKATLAQGIVKDGETATLQLLKADNTDFNNFTDSFDNNMYHFEKADKNGNYTITQTNSGGDVVIEDGGQQWVADAASAYVDGNSFEPGTVAAEIADKLASLAQNDVDALITEIKALAPTETAEVQGQSIENASRLFKTVDSYLRGERDPLGLSSGDILTDVDIWAKPYFGQSKIGKRHNIASQKTLSRGIISGLEKKLNPTLKMGIGLQYDSTDIDTKRHNMDISTLVGFIYGEYKPSEWFVNTTVSYGQSGYDEYKYALGTKYKADYDVRMTSVAAVVGREFKYITPEAGLRYYHITREGYRDTASQYVHASTSDYLRATTGVRLAKDYGIYRPDVYFGLAYDVTTPKNNTLVNLVNGSSYVVKGKRLPRLEYELNIGLNAHLTDKVTLGASYMGAYRNKYQEHTGLIRFKYNF